MHKPELISYIADELDITKEEANRYLNTILDQITYGLTTDGEVVLTGFGSFKAKEYAARSGVNPKTRETISIPAGKRVSFKAGSNLKALVNK